MEHSPFDAFLCYTIGQLKLKSFPSDLIMKLKDKLFSRGTTPQEIYEEDIFWSNIIAIGSIFLIILLRLNLS